MIGEEENPQPLELTDEDREKLHSLTLLDISDLLYPYIDEGCEILITMDHLSDREAAIAVDDWEDVSSAIDRWDKIAKKICLMTGFTTLYLVTKEGDPLAVYSGEEPKKSRNVHWLIYLIITILDFVVYALYNGGRIAANDYLQDYLDYLETGEIDA